VAAEVADNYAGGNNSDDRRQPEVVGY